MAKFGKRMATSDSKLARYMRQVIVYKSYPEYFPNRSAVPAKLQDALQIVENAGSFSHFENPKAEVFQDFQKKVGAQVAKLAVFNTTITLMSFAFFGVVYYAWSKKSADQQDVASNAQSSGQEQQYQITKQNYVFKPREGRPNPSFQDAWIFVQEREFITGERLQQQTTIAPWPYANKSYESTKLARMWDIVILCWRYLNGLWS